MDIPISSVNSLKVDNFVWKVLDSRVRQPFMFDTSPQSFIQIQLNRGNASTITSSVDLQKSSVDAKTRTGQSLT